MGFAAGIEVYGEGGKRWLMEHKMMIRGSGKGKGIYDF